MENNFSKQLNMESPYDLAIPLLGLTPEEFKAGTRTFVHPSSWQHYSQSQKVEATQVSLSMWTDTKKWPPHPTEYFSTLKREEILMHIKIWRGLGAQKDIHCMILLIWSNLTILSHRDRKYNRAVVVSSWGKGLGISSFSWEVEHVMEMHGNDSCTTIWMYLMPLNCMDENH